MLDTSLSELEILLYGYYPTDENGKKGYDMKDLLKSPGTMVIHTEKAFNDQYEGQNITSFHIKLTGKQTSNLENNLRGYTTNPGTYSLAGNTCTSVAINELTRIGVSIITLTTDGAYRPIPIRNGAGYSPTMLLNSLNLPYNSNNFYNKTWFKVP